MSVWKDTKIVDAYLKNSAIPSAAEQIHALLHILRHNGRPLRRFVDLGAGDGIISRILLDHFEDAVAVLVDFSGPMLEAAEKRLSDYAGRVTVVDADLASSDWQDRVFSGESDTVDAFVSRYSIHHLHNGRKYALYEELFKRLSPGGVFVNVEHVSSKSGWGEMMSNEAFIDRMIAREEGKTPARPPEQVRRDFLTRPDQDDNKLLAAETQCDWLRLIGYADVDIYFKCFELAVFAGRKPEK